MDAEKLFRKLSMDERVAALRKEGEYVGSRFHSAFHIHLYIYRGLYVELWYKIGINLIHFIEVQKNHDILALYTDTSDVYRNLGIDPPDK